MNFKRAVSILILAIVVTSFPVAAHAELYGRMYGNVISKDVILGPGGLTNQITLTINTNDGNSWFIICKRASSNLGWCDPVPVNASVYAEGQIMPFVGQMNCGWMPPTLVQWMSR
jgi:hypothetical protein